MSRMVAVADKQAAHGEENYSLRDVEASFMIADKSAVAGESADAAPDDPAARDRPENRLSVGAAHNFDHETQKRASSSNLQHSQPPSAQQYLTHCHSIRRRHGPRAINHQVPSWLVPNSRKRTYHRSHNKLSATAKIHQQRSPFAT